MCKGNRDEWNALSPLSWHANLWLSVTSFAETEKLEDDSLGSLG